MESYNRARCCYGHRCKTRICGTAELNNSLAACYRALSILCYEAENCSVFILLIHPLENAGESLLSLSNPANHVAPPAFPRFTEDGDHFTTFANMATQPLTYRVEDGRSQM
ncbi:uncharacterized protein LOC126609707 [Malus sylvestris]|uniref:uncharacterized protein LOC126609707 n=1 Tax=Malus sylvestris TaxID=3752 RepID=UPI0021AC5F51|nr:uncharacterized protein LOC126609707 [Malus sylvestris]